MKRTAEYDGASGSAWGLLSKNENQMLAMVVHGYSNNSRNHGIPSRCICATPAVCHWHSVWYLERSKVAAAHLKQTLEARSRFRALPKIGPTSTVAGTRQNMIRTVTMACLTPKNKQSMMGWIGGVLNLSSPRIGLVHYHKDFTDIYAAAKAVTKHAQFKLAWERSPLTPEQTRARLEDGTATYIGGLFVALPTFAEEVRCPSCGSESLSSFDPGLFRALIKTYKDFRPDGDTPAASIVGEILGANGKRRVLGECEQCKCLKANDELAKLRAQNHIEIATVLAQAPGPVILSRCTKMLGPQNLFELMLKSDKDIDGKGFELLLSTGARRGRDNDSGNVARVFGLVMPPIMFTVVVMDSTSCTAYTNQTKGFRDSQMVGMSPNVWRASAFKISRRMLLPGTNILVVKWSDGKDPTIVQFGCIDAPVETKVASFKAVRRGGATEMSERGGGAFGIMHTNGKLTPHMKAQLKERGGLFVPCKGISMKHIYLHHNPRKRRRSTNPASFLRVVPHQATNEKKTMDITVAAAKSILRSCGSTREIWAQQAKGLLQMGLIAKTCGIKELDRTGGFLACLGLALADKDWMALDTDMSILKRALLQWWTLDSTRAQNSVKQWTAMDQVSGHFDTQHRADCLFPEVLDIRRLESGITAQTIIPRRKVAYELEASSDQMIAWWQSVHFSDRRRGIDTSMTVLSI